MMKKLILLLAMYFTINSITFSQITNTFPLNDSVGIGTTTPTELLSVAGHISFDTYQRLGEKGGIFLGGGALVFSTGLFNVAIGGDALHYNTSGHGNIAIGGDALRNNTIGYENSAVGNVCMFNNTKGNNNTSYGSSALYFNSIGNDNTAVGNGSLGDNTKGNSNVAVGIYAAAFNIKGSYNTAIGSQSYFSNTKGMNNTACGANALFFPTHGSDNTAVGYQADFTGNFTNSTVIGANASVDANNKVRIGNSSILSNGGQVEWTAYSDARIKTRIKENVPGLEFINLLQPVTYHFDVDKQNTLLGKKNMEKTEGMYDIEKIQWSGFLAQDVEAAAKKIKYDFSGVDNSGEIMGLRYAVFVVPLVKAVQELSQQNDEMQQEIDDLKNQIENKPISTSSNTNAGFAELKISDENTSVLGQNIPNPFNASTLIPFRIPKNCSDASIMILNAAEGKVITVIPITCSETHISIDAGTLASGTYTYSLIVDGKIIATKQMVIAK